MASPSRPSRSKRAPKLDFPVTAEVIAKAVPNDSAHCMIAEALKEAVPHARAVSVDLATIRYTDSVSKRRLIYLTPAPAQVALLDFDHGQVPEPFQVAAHAAQIIEPKVRAKKAASPSPSETTSPSLSDTTAEMASPSHSETPEPRTYERATVISNPAGGGTVPIKVGGKAPPLGPLARGKGSAKVRTGRVRRFGLKAMGR